jgi:CubicO group peptidase (beta-lactamase class C family)
VTTTTPDPYAVVPPADVGIDPQKLEDLITRARREIDAGLLPSCQLALAKDGRLVHFETFGDADPGSRYVIFSCTKAVIAGAIWLLMSDGELDVSTRVCEIVPEFGTNGKDVITVEQLLTHTSGFPRAPLDFARITTRDGRLERFSAWRLNWEPGSRFEYHPTSAHWVLGEIIERLGKVDVRTFVDQRIAQPLGLRSLKVGEPPDRQRDVNELVAVGEPPTPEELEKVLGIPGIDLSMLVGEVTQEALIGFNDTGVKAQGVPGGGGISTAADLALYYQALLHNPGGLWNAEVLTDGTSRVRCDHPDPIRGNPSHRSLGLTIAGDPPGALLRGYGHGQSPRSFGHGGAGGQIAWADPDSGISFSYVTNGLDADLIREGRRTIGLASRANACAPH